MNNYQQSQIANLKAQISQLQAEKEQLRLLVHELIEAFCKINQKQTSSHWTFNPDLATLFKNLANFKTCSHQQTSKFTANDNNFNECNWDQMHDIFAKMKPDMKGEHD